MALLDKIDRMTQVMGNALEKTAGGGVIAGAVQAAPERRNWSSILGGNGGGSGNRIDWSGRIFGNAQGGSWTNAASGGDFSSMFDLSGFDRYAAIKGQREQREELERQKTGTATTSKPLTETGPSGATGSYDSQWGDKHEQYRPWIEQYAKANGIDPDALAAMLWIETDGDPSAVSHAGARGLGQIMPDTWAGIADPGDNPFNAEHSIKNAARYFAQQYRTYGTYENAAAAYLGGGGGVVNGKPNPNNNDGPGGVGGNSSRTYADMFNRNLAAIKATAPKQAPGYTGGGVGLSSLFGGASFPTTQAFGRTGFSTGKGAGIYDFGADFGLDGDSHSGWDIGSPVGTNFYLPTGMTGVVTIAGGSGYYKDEQKGNAPGTGELRITLSNGDEIIFGHNANINVKVGQQVTAGMLLGQTGWTTGGAHLHIEVRRRDRSTRSGWRIIDPAVYFGQQATGGGHDGHDH